MGFILTDLGNEENVLFINFWNWRPTVELIRTFQVIDDARIELMQVQCVGATVGKLEARRIGEMMQTKVLAHVADTARVKLDLAVTDEPDDFTLHRDEQWQKNYSATAPWLKRFTHFCLTCEGFKVF